MHFTSVKFGSKFLGNFYVMPKINKQKEILKEIEKSIEIYTQMEPTNN